MKPWRLALLGGVLWTRVVCGEGADTGGVTRYTLEECIRLGLRQSPVSTQARLDQDIAMTRVTQTRAEALPNLALKGVYTRLDDVEDMSLGETSVQAGNLDNYSATASLSQLLYAGGRVDAALRAARLTREYANLARQEAESALVRDIRLGFYGLLMARSDILVRDESVRQLTALRDQTEEKFRNGRASEFDLINARVRLANEAPVAIRSRNSFELAREEFRRLLNLDDAPFELVGELAPCSVDMDLAVLQERALEQRPLLRQMEVVVLLREQDVRAARSASLPSLRAQFAYIGANAYQFVPYGDQWQWHWNAGLVLDWNLWDGGLARGQVQEKRLTLEKERTALDDLRRTVLLQVKQAYLDFRHAAQTVAAGEGNTALAEKGLDIAKARHASGLGTFLEFTDSNLALSTARLTHLKALHDQLSARARLLQACGLSEADPDEENDG